MTSLIRWDPFDEVVSLQRAMDRLMEETWPFPSLFRERVLDLAMDMYETDDSVVVKTAVPGVKPEDIEVTVVGNTLTIKGETKAEEKVEEKNYIRRERRYGKFARTVALPTHVEPDKAKAEFENGILTLTIPKKEEAKPKTIEVKAK